jgi:hypothetical protein
MKSYPNVEHFCKVFYTFDKGRHRPYLEIIVANYIPNSLFVSANQMSPRILGLVDSGADHTLLPYSIGKSIGLLEQQEEESPIDVGGVGGNINCLERKCVIYIANKLKKEVYRFAETVWWKVPTASVKEDLEKLTKDFSENENLLQQSKEGTELHDHFRSRMEVIRRQVSAINATLEGDPLIGRPFFDNFEFIQFNHNDRQHEEKCFFNYKVKKSKIMELIPIPLPSGQPNQANAIGVI